MNRKPPIRTYKRRNAASNAVLFHGTSSTVSGGKKWISSPERENTIKIESNENDSLGYDPFDTTFDRLARNARLPPPLCNNEENSWLSSSDNTSRDEGVADNNSVSRVSIDLSNLNIRKHVPIKAQTKRSHTRVLKGKDSKQISYNCKRRKLSISINKSSFSNNAIKKQKKGTSTKILQEQNENIIKEEQLVKDKNIPLLSTSNFQQEGKLEHSVDWYKVENSAMNVSALMKAIDIKPCSVKLQDLYEEKENERYIQNIGKTMESTILLKHISEVGNNSEMKLNYYKSEIVSQCNEKKIQNCFVKLERLEPVFSENKAISKPKVNAICSTPMHKHKSRVLHSLLLSPIPIYCNKEPAILKEQTNNRSRNNSNQYSMSFKLDNTETSFTTPKSIKSDRDHSCYNQLKQITHKECIQEDDSDLLSRQKCLKEVNDRKNITNTIPITDRSESLLKERKVDVNSSSSIQNSNCSESDMFSQIGASTSSICQSMANRTSEDDGCSNFMCKDLTKTSDVKCIDVIETQDTQLTLSKRNNNSFESILTGTLSIENPNDQDDNEQMKNDKTTSLLELTSEKSVENNSFLQLRVVLQRLQDSVRVTNRRKQYRKWTLALSKISGESSISNNMSKISESIKENEILPIPCNEERSIEKTSVMDTDLDLTSRYSKKSFFLKRGKSWTRSLSILNNVQNGVDSDTVAYGKGKKWSHSVKDVLGMQMQGIEENSFKENENIDHESLQISESKLNDECNRIRSTANFGRISTRISVRVVQTGKPAKHTDDASFLEAYGILPTINDTRTSTLPRRTLINNIGPVNNLPQFTQDYTELRAKDAVLNRCKQKDFLSFAKYFSESYLGCCTKIGEGVYGEVFLHEDENNKSVIKIIPIEGTESVNGEPQKKFGEILSEIVIAMELHNLRFSSTHWTDGFVTVRSIKCVKGKYPDKLIELWKLYDDEKGSDNDCPAMFNKNQLYIILELGHGGQDLEAYIFHTAEQALASFQQAAVALAVAEDTLQFEHRDLHWGNLLISKADEKHIRYKLPDREFNVPTKGVKVSIIDFTLSRMSYESCCIFNDLALDPALFTAQGDYQFEIYRLMKDTVGNQWEKFEPYTNVLWLHYTLDKMISEVRYKKNNLKTHKNAISKLVSVKNEILNYQSAYDFVTNSDIFAKVQRTNPR